MHRSRPLPNTFTAILNTLWMCAYPDCKPESRVRGLVCPDLGLQPQSPVQITTTNPQWGGRADLRIGGCSSDLLIGNQIPIAQPKQIKSFHAAATTVLPL